MVNDRQTHDLPEQADEMDRIARFMGYPDARDFALAFLRHVDIVRAELSGGFRACARSAWHRGGAGRSWIFVVTTRSRRRPSRR